MREVRARASKSKTKACSLLVKKMKMILKYSLMNNNDMNTAFE